MARSTTPTIAARVRRTAVLYLRDGETMRSVAKSVGVSVFTVHRDLVKVLPSVAPDLAAPVQAKIEAQIAIRPRLGGLATRGVPRWRGRGREEIVTGD